MNIIISKNSIARSIHTPICITISLDNLGDLIAELRMHHHRWTTKGVSYGRIGISGDINGISHGIPNTIPEPWEKVSA